MTLAIRNLMQTWGDADFGVRLHLPVAASTHIFEGTLIAQLNAGGTAVPYSTASSSMCIGVSTHEQDNSLGAAGAARIEVITERIYLLPNGTAGDAFADTDQIGSVCFGTDDHTAAKTSGTQTRQPIGFFYGLDPDTGLVKVLISPTRARAYVALVNALTFTVGTATNTIADVGVAFNQAPLNNNFASLASKVDAILAALAP